MFTSTGVEEARRDPLHASTSSIPHSSYKNKPSFQFVHNDKTTTTIPRSAGIYSAYYHPPWKLRTKLKERFSKSEPQPIIAVKCESIPNGASDGVRTCMELKVSAFVERSTSIKICVKIYNI